MEEKIKKEPDKRDAQRILSREVTSLVHGRQEMLRAEKISQSLFYGNIKDLSEEEIEEGLKSDSRTEQGTFFLPEKGTRLIEFLLSNKIDSSIRQAKEDIKNRAITINGEICTDINKMISASDTLFGKYIFT